MLGDLKITSCPSTKTLIYSSSYARPMILFWTDQFSYIMCQAAKCENLECIKNKGKVEKSQYPILAYTYLRTYLLAHVQIPIFFVITQRCTAITLHAPDANQLINNFICVCNIFEKQRVMSNIKLHNNKLVK